MDSCDDLDCILNGTKDCGGCPYDWPDWEDEDEEGRK
jgi:hypothetical protein